MIAETNDEDNKVTYCTDDISVTPDLDGQVFIQLNTTTPMCKPHSSNLTAYRRYNAMIAAKNNFGERNSTGKIPFSKLYNTSII